MSTMKSPAGCSHQYDASRYCVWCGAPAQIVEEGLVSPMPLTPAQLRLKRQRIAASDRRQGFEP